ncbi:MAG: hypothetical protein K0Q78_731 [Cellvibrio sp.]|nr:hypothetical protein [Cellvibrio sp.]
MNSLGRCLALALACACSSLAVAGEITCLPDNQRVATLNDAIECKTLNSVNLHSPAQIDALYDDLGNAWVKEGELTSAGSNDLFTITADSWGIDVEGHWYISAAFWQTYGRAVITMHVGQGGGNPDAFAWLITPGTLAGDFSYQRVAGSGGGLSNLFLFGSGKPVSVDPHEVSESSIAFLLLIGLCSLVISRRRSSV